LIVSCPIPEDGEENNTKHPAEEPNPNSVQDAGTNVPPRVLVKDTFPVGVASECEESEIVTLQIAFDPACRGEGVQLTFTTMPRRLVVVVE
jgi:hypothetical protein